MFADNYELIGKWGKEGHFRITGWQWLNWGSGPALPSDSQLAGGTRSQDSQLQGPCQAGHCASAPPSTLSLSFPKKPSDCTTLIKTAVMWFYGQELLIKLNYSQAHCWMSMTFKNCFLVFQVKKITSHLKTEIIYTCRGKPKIFFKVVVWNWEALKAGK